MQPTMSNCARPAPSNKSASTVPHDCREGQTRSPHSSTSAAAHHTAAMDVFPTPSLGCGPLQPAIRRRPCHALGLSGNTPCRRSNSGADSLTLAAGSGRGHPPAEHTTLRDTGSVVPLTRSGSRLWPAAASNPALSQAVGSAAKASAHQVQQLSPKGPGAASSQARNCPAAAAAASSPPVAAGGWSSRPVALCYREPAPAPRRTSPGTASMLAQTC